MKALLAQHGNRAPHGIDGVGDIGPRLQRSSVMQTEYGSVRRASQNSPGDRVRGPFPVFPNSTPQHTGESKPPLRAAHAEPADPEGRAEVTRLPTGGFGDY